MLRIDGSYGEGGGQILRSSLALSLVTGKPFTIENIRKNRRKPGLLRQHLTSVQAATTVGQAKVQGDLLGAETLVFEPSTIQAGQYNFAVGTAGSTSLILQTVLPALMTAKQQSYITLGGGTHNPWAPPYHFIEQAFIPLINRMGPNIESELERVGFYPAGGGLIKIAIKPAHKLNNLELLTKGELHNKFVLGLFSHLPFDIISREFKVLKKHLDWEESCYKPHFCKTSKGPGNALVAVLECDNITEVFTGFGMKEKSANIVAKELCDSINKYLTSEAVIGEYLADQLLIPMALSGKGVFSSTKPSKHTLTNAAVIKQFLDINIDMTEKKQDCWIIEIG